MLKCRKRNVCALLNGPRDSMATKRLLSRLSMCTLLLQNMLLCARFQADAWAKMDWKLNLGKSLRFGGAVVSSSCVSRRLRRHMRRSRTRTSLDPYFTDALHSTQDNWRTVVAPQSNMEFLSQHLHLHLLTSTVIERNGFHKTFCKLNRLFRCPHIDVRMRPRPTSTDWPEDRPTADKV